MTDVRKRLIWIGVFVFSLLAAPTMAGPRARVDKDVSDALRDGTTAKLRIIVKATTGASSSTLRFLQSLGLPVKQLPDGQYAVTVSLGMLKQLTEMAEIEQVSTDAAVHADDFGWTSGAPNNALRLTLGVPGTITGHDIGIAVIDSGLAPTADLYGRIAAVFDCTQGCVQVSANDPYGHGTHIAGLAGGSGYLSGGRFVGAAPRAHFVGLKVLDATGAGVTSDVINALDFITGNAARYGVKVVNLSLGHPILEPSATDPLVQAVERASRAGLIVVTSAGNFGTNPTTGKVGYAGITSPGNAPSALTVGSLGANNTIQRGDDLVAPYSSRGPTWYDAFAKPDVIAPGNRLNAAVPSQATLAQQGIANGAYVNGYLSLSGTSMAAGVTSGVVAAMLEANPAHRLTPNAVKAILQFSAVTMKDETGKRYDRLTQGAGAINANGAIRLASAIDSTVPVGAPWLTRRLFAYSRIGGQNVVWGQSIDWGTTIVRGTGTMLARASAYDDNIVWGTAGDNIVWGTAADPGDNIVWGTIAVGDNIVWGTAADDNIVWGTSAFSSSTVHGTANGDNIVWGTADADNIVWGTSSDDNIVWGTVSDDNIVWGTMSDDNIVWGTATDDNIVWGTAADDNIVWGTAADNIVWGTASDDNIVWGTNIVWSTAADNIVWGTVAYDNIVWGTAGDNIVWGTAEAAAADESLTPDATLDDSVLLDTQIIGEPEL